MEARIRVVEVKIHALAIPAVSVVQIQIHVNANLIIQVAEVSAVQKDIRNVMKNVSQ